MRIPAVSYITAGICMSCARKWAGPLAFFVTREYTSIGHLYVWLPTRGLGQRGVREELTLPYPLYVPIWCPHPKRLVRLHSIENALNGVQCRLVFVARRGRGGRRAVIHE